MFTLSGIVTLGFGAWFGSEAFNALAKDLADKRLKHRAANICTDLLFIALATCAVVTACHNLTHIWIR